MVLRAAKAGSVLVTAVLAIAAVMRVGADTYPRYNDGCQNCHGAFTDGTSPGGTVFPEGDKHEMHRGAAYMNADCNLCHTTGDNRNPFLGSSNGTANNPGIGCTGCHGADYGGVIGNSAVGLRAHHAASGVTICSSCHSDPAPLPEDVRPTYYGTVDTAVDDPCNSPPAFLENWTIGDTLGLDNDGDELYDGNDADCAACPGDVNGDGQTDLADLAILLSQFGQSGDLPADLDNSGTVDLADLAILLSDFGCTG